MKKKAVRKSIPLAHKWEVVWVPMARVQGWKDNPRINSDATKLAELIKAHGFRSPIICWDKNDVIYKGNTTLKACKILKADGWLDENTEGKIPVVFHHFSSENAAKAYGISDNKASEFTGWDEEVLRKLMSQDEIKKSNTGFASYEIESIFLQAEPTKAPNSDPDKKLFDTIKLKVELKHIGDVREVLEEFFIENDEYGVTIL